MKISGNKVEEAFFLLKFLVSKCYPVPWAFRKNPFSLSLCPGHLASAGICWKRLSSHLTFSSKWADTGGKVQVFLSWIALEVEGTSVLCSSGILLTALGS